MLTSLTVATLVLQLAPAANLRRFESTSGQEVSALLDAKHDTHWTPGADIDADALRLEFEQPQRLTVVKLKSCAKAAMTVTALVDGVPRASVQLNAGAEGSVLGAVQLSSLTLWVSGSKTGLCLSKLSFGDLLVAPPRVLSAEVKASSVKAPEEFNRPALLFDGRLDLGWSQGTPGTGVGQSVTVTLDKPTALEAIEVWAGNSSSAEVFKMRARVKALTATVDAAAQKFSFSDEPKPQKLPLKAPKPVKSITVLIDEVYPGTRWQDVGLMELRLSDAAGPLSIVPSDGATRTAAFKKTITGSPLERVVDQPYTSVCAPERRLRLRGDRTFVLGEGKGLELKLTTGSWRVRSLPEMKLDLLGWTESRAGQVSGLGGGAITTVESIGRDPFAELLSIYQSDDATLQAEASCDAVRDFAALVKRGAIVVEGANIHGIYQR